MAEDHWYLTVDKDQKHGGFIAVMTQGHPRFGDKNCTVLSVTRVVSKQEAEQWYSRMKIERPWETRQ
jgi:hypothetical protein